jgi:ribosome-binding protein aMBF1 (putative translation factor)
MSTKKAARKAMNKTLQELLPQMKDSERYDQEVLRSDISDQIVCLMESQGITKAELARRLKTSKAYITKILQGNANFTLDSLAQISRALGCKYVARIVPLDVWKHVEAVQFSAPTKSASPAESYRARPSVTTKTETR